MRLVYLTLYLLALLNVSTFANEITISPGGLSIKDAVARAKSSDTLYIKSGTYKEGNIIIEKSLTIIAEELQVLDVEHKFEIFTFHAHHDTITVLKLINSETGSINDIAAIKILVSKWIRITNKRFDKSFFGI